MVRASADQHGPPKPHSFGGMYLVLGNPPPARPPAGSFEGSFWSCLLRSPWVAQSPRASLQITELSRLASRTPTVRRGRLWSQASNPLPPGERGGGGLGVRAGIRPMDFRTPRCGFCLEIPPLVLFFSAADCRKTSCFTQALKSQYPKNTPNRRLQHRPSLACS